MIKFIGFTVIILGTTLIGFKRAGQIKERYNSLTYLYKVMIMLRGEIDYNVSEMNEIFRTLHSKTKGSLKKFFFELYESTRMQYEQSINIYWNMSVDRYLCNMNFTAQDIDMIKELGENLGYLDKNMQLKNIDYLLNYIDRELKELGETMDKNMKMYKMFGVLAGIFIIIVLC